MVLSCFDQSPSLWPSSCNRQASNANQQRRPMSSHMDQSFRIDPADLPGEDVIFGTTPAMREVHGMIGRVLHNDLPVLIRGESGTGKEVVARFLHTRSNRRDAPFVKLNCAAVPVSLLESE